MGYQVSIFHILNNSIDDILPNLKKLDFVFLALHLLHGFNSAFQSVGANNKYTKGLKGFGKAYAIIIPLGFVFIALFHYFNH